jgi:hypothetical protein
VSGFVPLNEKKLQKKKKKVLGRFGLWWEKEKKYGNGGDGRPAVGGGGAEVLAVSGGGDGCDWWGLDIREFGWWDLREKGGKLYGGGGENGEKGDKQ